MDGAAAKKQQRASMKKIAKEVEKAVTKKTSVGAEFKVSLESLMEEMRKAAPHFVRCLKPNLAKQPAPTWEAELVTNQLRYTGMLETTRIRKEGFSDRPSFQDFVDRYKLIGFGARALFEAPEGTVSSCSQIIRVAVQRNANMNGTQMGHTKVFMRFFHTGLLNE